MPKCYKMAQRMHKTFQKTLEICNKQNFLKLDLQQPFVFHTD